MHKRAELVGRLIRSGPLPEADLRRLASFGWDRDADLVLLTRADACGSLHRHLHGELTADALVEWANQIEGREDIGFQTADENALKDLIFELANPGPPP